MFSVQLMDVVNEPMTSKPLGTRVPRADRQIARLSELLVSSGFPLPSQRFALLLIFGGLTYASGDETMVVGQEFIR